MKAKLEYWSYGDKELVWAGRYLNSQNLPHWHYDCELVHVDKGALDVLCNRALYHLTAGQTFYIDTEQVHYMHALSPDTEVTMIVFKYEVIKPLADTIRIASPLLSRDYGIREFYAEIMREIREAAPLYQFSVSIKTSRFMLEIFRNEKTLPRTDDGMRDSLKDLLSDIAEHYPDYDLDTAASFMNMNSSYFSRMFHDAVGVTFTQYLTYTRCMNALNMLRMNDMTIAEVASRCGFMTIRNFNRMFKSFTGYTPTGLPDNYIIKGTLPPPLNKPAATPTLAGCVMLEWSYAER